ncbi:ArsR family transcriptional regulator [Mesobaculum littorinae]|uniref:ArsR family transcriptional regulator n=1 Tax=Mesobaculum littorinae TaxID=2486419 RepID=A0A438AL32_9RHOB|nr:metalloregulator ArsR/SmtB family transcription factor [Mesobaculum littorinae]RVV99287.1 ArsR family transcriptional regulator [Mesobaculum littorinae]
MAYEIAIAALGDPTRRAILEALRARPLPVAALAAELPVSRPAVSQHLKVMCAAGLLTCTPSGARRIYAIDPAALAELRDWLDRLWDDALTSFADAARAQARRSGDPA